MKKILSTLYKPIRNDLLKVDAVIGSYAKAVGVGPAALKGKRLRAALVLFSSQRMRAGKNRIHYATAIELIHIASLLHDDIIDYAPIRHHQKTVSTERALCLGDYFFGKANVEVSLTKKPELLHALSTAVSDLATGQLIQLDHRNNVRLSRQLYLKILSLKTAALFKACCALSSEKRLEHFAYHLGMAYQVIDDVVDVFGSRKMLGKEPGENISTGEMTLPFIVLRGRLSVLHRRKFDSLFRRKQKKQLIAFMHTHKKLFLPSVHKTIAFYLDQAYRGASDLHDEELQQVCFKLIELLKKRLALF